MEATDVPHEFGEDFLRWFRRATEEAWQSHVPLTFDDYTRSRIGGADWQRGTRWVPLSSSEIGALEARNGSPFPDDHRLFLRHLHATDRPRLGAGYRSPGNLVAIEKPGFYNWLTEFPLIAGAIEDVFEGLAFDVENHVFWPESWGPRPSSTEGRRAVLRARLAEAPPLLPLTGHRFVLGGDFIRPTPVLSVHQSDIIVYGADLRHYLLAELGRLVGVHGVHGDLGPSPEPDYAGVPFWGGFL